MAEPYARYAIKPFHSTYAPLVASWIPTDDDLFWLAPHTPPPITSEKVLAWTAHGGRPRLFYTSPWPDPTGYAELNDLPNKSGELWIGHFIIAPQRRRMSLGSRMLGLLLAEAFGPLDARRVALIVFPENKPAIRCYKACGMRAVAWQDKTFTTRPGAYRMIEMEIERSRYEATLGTRRSP